MARNSAVFQGSFTLKSFINPGRQMLRAGGYLPCVSHVSLEKVGIRIPSQNFALSPLTPSTDVYIDGPWQTVFRDAVCILIVRLLNQPGY
jgi:hypothetical protein